MSAQILPVGGNVVAGSGSIATSGNTMTVTQTSNRMAADWQSFHIGQGHTVNFVQPSTSSVALNRVLGADVSVIQGALNANGQVFLINPNGVLFTPTAQVNVGGVVASTLNISTADFMAGNYKFLGASSSAIVNQGNITAQGDGSSGGTIALIAAKITNHGSLTAKSGNVLLGAGSKVTLDLGGRVKLQVEQGAIDALIEQGGAIKADGGLVYLTAKAAGDLVSTVIKHTGNIEANTLASGETGEIFLMGGMVNDRIEVGGKLDAAAPDGGNGGFIETSAARVNIQNDFQVTTAAKTGITGQWLIDPQDITIAASGGNVTGSAIATALLSTNVTLDTSGASCMGVACSGLTGTDGDIYVKDNINVVGGSADTTLTLKANRDISMDAGKSISRTGGFKLNTVFWADSDATGGGRIATGDVNAFNSSGTSISSNGGDITLGGGLSLASGYAKGSSTQSSVAQSGTGVLLAGTALNSGGGNIVIRGEGADSAVVSDHNVHGVWLRGGTVVNSGTGTIDIAGKSPSTTGWRNAVITDQGEAVKLLSASTSANAIRINGDASTAVPAGVDSCCAYGVFLWNGTLIAATGAGGGITLNGQGGTVGAGTAGGGGLQLELNSYILANGGLISLTGAKGTGSVYEDIVINGMVGFASSLAGPLSATSSPVTASSSNVSITADSLSNTRVFSGGGTPGAIQSTGTLTIAPRTTGKALSVQTANPGGTALWINPTSMFGTSGLFKTGFTKLAFGSSTTGNVTLNNYTFDNDTELNTSGNAVLGAVGIANHALAVNMTGSGTITNTGAVAVSKLKLNGSTSAATLTNTGNAIGTLAADVASLSLVSSSALTVGTVGAMSGVTAAGAIDIATLTGDLAVSQNVTSADSGATALVLNAGKSAAAGTSTGGNVVLSGAPTLSVGAGGRATLFTGSVAGSTGVGALVGSGSGHFRYNSDEAASNYTTVLGTGLYAVYREQPTIAVTANAATKTYDGVAYTGGNGVVYSGFVNGDTSAALTGTVAYGGTSQGATAAATYTITPGGLGNGLGYLLAYTNGTLTIDPALLTVVTASLTGSVGKTYDGTTAATLAPGNFSLAGFAAGEGASVTQTSGTFDNAAAGTNKTVTVSLSNSDFSATGATVLSNYMLPSSASGSIGTIEKAPLVVTANATSKTYNGEAYSGGNGVTYSGFVNGETNAVLGGTLTYGGTSQGAKNAGSYVISAAGLTSNNYLITASNGTLTIDPRAITVTADSMSKTYGNADPALTYAVTSGSLVNGDKLGTLTRAAGENVGGYNISASGLANGNYLITANNGMLTIDPRAITVTADSKSKTYGNADPLLTYAVTSGSVVNGDKLGTLTRAAGENVGSYTINASALANGNYLITANNGTLTIDPRAITVTADSKSKTYGNADPALTYSVTSGTVVSGDTLSGALTRASGEAVGNYTINASALANGNYLITAKNGTLTIDPLQSPLQTAVSSAQTLVVAGRKEGAGPEAFGIKRVFVVAGGIKLPVGLEQADDTNVRAD